MSMSFKNTSTVESMKSCDHFLSMMEEGKGEQEGENAYMSKASYLLCRPIQVKLEEGKAFQCLSLTLLIQHPIKY